MKIEHLAIWVQDLEKMRAFYENYFQAKAGEQYHNPTKNFTSYFLTFESGCRLELMHKPEIAEGILKDFENQDFFDTEGFKSGFVISLFRMSVINVQYEEYLDVSCTIV